MNKIHPIHFSIAKEKIVKEIPKKKKILATIIPGKLDTYIFKNEEDYYQDYKDSMFGITMKKSGWDCLRHYEILANGCIPYFVGIENIPFNTMTRFPKEKMIDSNRLYEKIQNKTIREVSEEEWREYYEYLEYYLKHTKEYLTTSSVGEYIIDKIGKKNIKKILYLSEDTNPDYLRCLTLHGLKTIFHQEVHDFPPIPHIYKIKDYSYKELYGKGMTYTNLLEISEHNFDKDNSIFEDIEKHKYDIIIYGSYHRGLPFWDKVNQHYQKNEIVLLCGEDEHCCDYPYFCFEGYNVFVRELL